MIYSRAPLRIPSNSDWIAWLTSKMQLLRDSDTSDRRLRGNDSIRVKAYRVRFLILGEFKIKDLTPEALRHQPWLMTDALE